jgi:hypothetical protein
MMKTMRCMGSLLALTMIVLAVVADQDDEGIIDCATLTACQPCVERDCAWSASRCLPSCEIADTACYKLSNYFGLDSDELCALENDEQNTTAPATTEEEVEEEEEEEENDGDEEGEIIEGAKHEETAMWANFTNSTNVTMREDVDTTSDGEIGVDAEAIESELANESSVGSQLCAQVIVLLVVAVVPGIILL